MEHQLWKVFKWVEKKHQIDDVAVLLHPDFSGSFVDARHTNNILFSFTDIMDVTKEDVDNFDLKKWLYQTQ